MRPFSIVYVCLFTGLLGGRALAQGYVQNGDFETGDFTGWTVYTTPNGTLGSIFGLPNVLFSDVNGSRTPSYAAQFQAGEAYYDGSTGPTPQGGGIYQTINCPAGQYLFSLDIAAQNIGSLQNGDAGLFTLLVNGNAVDSVEFGVINGGQTLRASLRAAVPLSAGLNEFGIEITRPWLNGSAYGASPLEYMDNVQVQAVPEPDAAVFGVGACFLYYYLKRPCQKKCTIPV